MSRHTRPAQAAPAFAAAKTPVVVRGDMLWSRYQVECVLRVDTDRTLLRARDLNGDEGTVAVELLDRAWFDDTSAQERLRARVAEVAGLRHSNLQRTIALEADKRRIGLIKEWTPGATLAQHWQGLIGRASPLPPNAKAEIQLVARFAEQIGRALDAVHDAGVVHGSVHPGNVIVCPGTHTEQGRRRSRVVLGGLDRVSPPASAEVEWSDDVTRSYRAPEIAHAPAQGGPSADRFALGALAYRLLTGEECGWPPRPPSQLVPALPPAAATQVMAYLKHHPPSRPQTAMLLGQTLSRVGRVEGADPAPAGLPPAVDPDAVTIPAQPAMAPEAVVLAPPTFQPPAPTPPPEGSAHLGGRTVRSAAGVAAQPGQSVDPGSIALQNGLLPGLGFHSLGEKGLAAGTFAAAVVVWIVSLGTAGWIVHVVAAVAGHNMALQRLKEEKARQSTDPEG